MLIVIQEKIQQRCHKIIPRSLSEVDVHLGDGVFKPAKHLFLCIAAYFFLSSHAELLVSFEESCYAELVTEFEDEADDVGDGKFHVLEGFDHFFAFVVPGS